MSIELRPYSRKPLETVRQGLAVRSLVAGTRVQDFLAHEREQTIARYRDRLHAIKNVGRIASSPEVHAAIICDTGLARGLATVILDQQVRHPEWGAVRGNNIDYWLIPGHNQNVHEDVTLQLLAMAKRLNDKAPNFAVVNPDPNFGPTTGFRAAMRLVSPEPAALTTDMPTDTYGITANGNPQLLFVDKNCQPDS